MPVGRRCARARDPRPARRDADGARLPLAAPRRGGTLENNRILLLSRSKAHPNGVGNDRGRVGKNYSYQIYPAPVVGLFEGRTPQMYMGSLDFMGGSQLYSEPCEREPFNSVKGLTTKDGKSWGADWKNEIRANWDSYAAIVTEGESPSYED